MELIPNMLFAKMDEALEASGGILYRSANFRKYLCDADFFTLFRDWRGTFMWDRQRQINEETVGDIVRSLESKDAEIMLMDMDIRIGMLLGDDPKIIDGQHRLAAMEQMGKDAKFIVSIYNFQTEEARFKEFVMINSNTPLPEYYKAITDRDSYCKTLAMKIFAVLKEEYKDFYKHAQYFLRPTDENEIYVALKHVGVQMDIDIDRKVKEFLETCKSAGLFPDVRARYVEVRANLDKCQAQHSKDNLNQCSNRKKDGTEYCGVHQKCGQAGSTCKTFSPRMELGARFSERREAGRGWFLLDSKWVSVIMENMFPML